jgi:protein-tyrosine phosphatase
MTGLVDLHCHVIPGVDDGPRSLADAVALVKGLRELGFVRLVATPHVRLPRWDQDLATLRALRDQVADAVGDGCPRIDIAAEHYFDDEVWQRFLSGELLVYPGGKAVLIELPNDDVPLGWDRRFFELSVKGPRPVLAHPERIEAPSVTIEALERLAGSGATLVVSLSSLAGWFTSPLRRRAEAIIKRVGAVAAASDAHSVAEMPTLRRGLARLRKLVGDEGVARMLSTTPSSLLGDDA